MNAERLSLNRLTPILSGDLVMSTVEIVIKNNLRLKSVQPGLSGILKQNLTIQNPKWLENQRLGRWNGSTPEFLKFFEETETGEVIIPRGYARNLIDLCRRHSVSFTLNDQRRNLESVEIPFTGKLRDFQVHACEEVMKKDFGTLNAPTGAGKTVMGIYIAAMRKQSCLIVVHTKDLALQWIERIAAFTGIGTEEVGVIGSGEKRIGRAFTVGTVQSIYKCAAEVAPFFGHIIVDECHRAPSRTFTEAVSAFDSKYMLGLSATMYRRDRLTKLIYWFIGPCLHEVNKTGLIMRGDILKADVVIRKTDFKAHFDPVTHYTKVMTELVSDDERNRLIAADVAKESATRDGLCIVLSDRKKHCEALSALLKFGHGIEAVMMTGDMSSSQRKDALEKIGSGNARVIVATGQLVGEGFDLKELSTLFLATPVRFSGRLLQYLGRVLRPAPGKKKARVFDYVDVNVEVLLSAAMARQRIYSGEQPEDGR